MKLYADAPARRTRQILADVLFVVWMVGWVWIGHVVQHGTMELAGRRSADRRSRPARWPTA